MSQMQLYRLALVPIDETYEGPERYSAHRMGRWLVDRLKDEPAEVAGTIWMTTHLQVLGWSIGYRGGIRSATVEPRGVLVPALLGNGESVVIFHTHPSGDLSPSQNDIHITRRIDEAARIVGIRLMDHLIVGPTGYHSMAWEKVTDPLKPVYWHTLLERHTHGDGRRNVAPKFRHPETGETWSGRGRMTRWLRQLVDEGHDIEEFRIRPGSD